MGDYKATVTKWSLIEVLRDQEEERVSGSKKKKETGEFLAVLVMVFHSLLIIRENLFLPRDPRQAGRRVSEICSESYYISFIL